MPRRVPVRPGVAFECREHRDVAKKRTADRVGTEELLREEYIGRIRDTVLRSRVERVLEWAAGDGRLLPRRAVQPAFGIASDSGAGLFSIWERGEWRGRVCWFFADRYYPEGGAARAALLQRLEAADPPWLDRWRARTDCVDIAHLRDLDESRFNALCEVWEAFGPARPPSAAT